MKFARFLLLVAPLTAAWAAAGCSGRPPAPPPATSTIDSGKADLPVASSPTPDSQAAAVDAEPDPKSKAEALGRLPPAEEAGLSSEATAEGQTAATSTNELSTERLVLLLPNGPLVVELQMTIDGEPFRAAREELIDMALKLADRDGDGEASWSEILSDPKRTFMQRYDLTLNNSNRKEFLRSSDTNQNGLLDRDEARRIVARAKSAGASFSLDDSSEYRHNQRQSIVRTMLDANEDDLLDDSELNAAEQRLLARDADNDHTLTWSEFDDSLAGDQQAMASRQNAYLNQPVAFLLGERGDWDGLAYAIAERYLQGGRLLDESFSLAPSLAGALDENGDGELTYEEVRRLTLVEPQIRLAVNFGKPGDKVAGVSLVRLSSELGPADRVVRHTPRGLSLAFDSYRLQVVVDDRSPAEAGEPSSEGQFAALDKDKNGYLEKDELTDVSPDIARMFEEVDANGDGKVYLEELTMYRRRQQAPQLSAVRAVAGDDQDVLFPLLDANQDGRLTTRELHDARRALLRLDADGDGQISLDELPGGLTLLLARGLPSNMPLRMFAARPEPVAPSGPAWFVHMDANRDQEISLDEFPGNPTKFRSLDLDGDGFLSASESAAAGRVNDAPTAQ